MELASETMLLPTPPDARSAEPEKAGPEITGGMVRLDCGQPCEEAVVRGLKAVVESCLWS